jgi:hypothetical protein
LRHIGSKIEKNLTGRYFSTSGRWRNYTTGLEAVVPEVCIWIKKWGKPLVRISLEAVVHEVCRGPQKVGETTS